MDDREFQQPEAEDGGAAMNTESEKTGSAGENANRSGSSGSGRKKRTWLRILIIVIIVLVCIAAALSVYAFTQKGGAEEAALNHAGLDRAGVSGLHSDLEMDGLTLTCDVSFWTPEAKYEYEVTVFGREVIQFDKELLTNAGQGGTAQNGGNDGGSDAAGETSGTAGSGGTQGTGGVQGGTGTQGSQSGGMIDDQAAKSAALSHAGLTDSEIYGYQSHIDNDHGTQVYEIEFWSEDYEYEYSVDAYSGEVLKFERDKGHH